MSFPTPQEVKTGVGCLVPRASGDVILSTERQFVHHLRNQTHTLSRYTCAQGGQCTPQESKRALAPPQKADRSRPQSCPLVGLLAASATRLPGPTSL